MEPTFRIADVSDLDTLDSMVSHFHTEENIAIAPAARRSALAQLLANDHLGQIWLVRADDRSAGYAILTFGFSIEFGGRDAFIDELYLAEEFRGRGWGRATIRAMADKARAASVRALHLEVTRGNARALQLYRSVGYEEHDRYLMTHRIHHDV